MGMICYIYKNSGGRLCNKIKSEGHFIKIMNTMYIKLRSIVLPISTSAITPPVPEVVLLL